MILLSGEGMLNGGDCFRGGRLDKDALIGFIKDIKKNTKLSDEDAAVIAASKVSGIKYSQIWNAHCCNCLSSVG